MTTRTKVRFSLVATATTTAATTGKRKRKLPPAAAAVPATSTAQDDSTHTFDEPRLRQLTGCFDVSAADDATIDMEQQARAKQPRLQLEDASAKTKRLQHEGNTLAEAGRFRAAMARWLEAIEIDATNAELFELLAQASLALGEDFRAIGFALRATQLAPTWGDAFHTLARCHVNYGELELARQHIDTALALTGATDELVQERADVDALLATQQRVIAAREAQEAQTTDRNALQALACLKHLALRGQTHDLH